MKQRIGSRPCALVPRVRPGEAGNQEWAGCCKTHCGSVKCLLNDQSCSARHRSPTMQRRTFLKRTASTTAAAFAAPAILHAEDKAGIKNPVIGEGEHRYECIHEWGQLPRHLRWETTH